jgi:hypothetical protein
MSNYYLTSGNRATRIRFARSTRRNGSVARRTADIGTHSGASKPPAHGLSSPPLIRSPHSRVCPSPASTTANPCVPDFPLPAAGTPNGQIGRLPSICVRAVPVKFRIALIAPGKSGVVRRERDRITTSRAASMEFFETVRVAEDCMLTCPAISGDSATIASSTYRKSCGTGPQFVGNLPTERT